MGQWVKAQLAHGGHCCVFLENDGIPLVWHHRQPMKGRNSLSSLSSSLGSSRQCPLCFGAMHSEIVEGGWGMREEGWRLVGGREEVIGLIHQGAPAVNYSLCTAGVSRTLPCAWCALHNRSALDTVWLTIKCLNCHVIFTILGVSGSKSTIYRVATLLEKLESHGK